MAMRPGAALLAAVVVLLALAGPASAQQPADDRQLLISADNVGRDEALGVVIARGNVEIADAQRVLVADVVSYNEATGVVTASGNVAVVEPSGDVLFADYIELTDGLAAGVARGLGVLMAEGARMAANGAIRTPMKDHPDEIESRMAKVVYTACDSCKEDPTRPPLWQIRARQVAHDTMSRDVVYRDAVMELGGVPVFYVPWFSHPDPGVDQRSGFLTPTWGTSSYLGFFTQIPYYWAIDDDLDLTFAPIITSKRGVILNGQVRHRFRRGFATLEGSLTRRDDDDRVTGGETNELRGNLRGAARLDLTRRFRAGAKLDLVTDKTYLDRYNIGKPGNTLTNRLFVEGFTRRSYAQIEGLLFQGLRPDDVDTEIPRVLPHAQYSWLGEPVPDIGGRPHFDADLRSVSREDGTDSVRMEVKTGWKGQYIGPIGEIWTLAARALAQGYVVANPDDPAGLITTENDDDGFVARIQPKGQIGVRWPLVRAQGTVRTIIEPQINAVIATEPDNGGLIPNEDSYSFELDDTNLMAMDRLPGQDRLDGGQRIDYGINFGVHGLSGGHTTAFIGQSYRFQTGGAYRQGSGAYDNLSDVVGRIRVEPHRDFSVQYRFRFDKDDFSNRHSEVDAFIDWDPIRFKASYLFLDGQVTSTGTDQSEFQGRLTLNLDDYWKVAAGTRYDIINDSFVKSLAGIFYEDECLNFAFTVEHSDYSYDDIKPDTAFKFSVNFVTLGNLIRTSF